ncbi:MAG: hypothetical protein IPJ34_05810 [Myxococcales bacterium]|nr:hypothetical protein [Myxococcales bacterium]
MQKWPALALGALSLVACKDPPKGAPTAAASTSAPSAGSAGGSVVASGSAPSTAPSVPAAPAASGSGAVVAFTLRAPVVGDETEEREQLEVHLALDVGAGTKTKGVELTQKDAIVRKTKVLAVDGKAVTKVQVTYVERSESVSQNGKEKKGQSPVTGHTYVLTARDGSSRSRTTRAPPCRPRRRASCCGRTARSASPTRCSPGCPRRSGSATRCRPWGPHSSSACTGRATTPRACPTSR